MTEKEVITLIKEYGCWKLKIEEIDGEIEDIKKTIEHLRELKAVNNDGMPKGNGRSNPTEKVAQEIIDIYEKRILELKASSEEVLGNRRKCEELLSRLTDEEVSAVKGRYIQRVKGREVPYRLFMSRAKYYKLVKNGIGKMMK